MRECSPGSGLRVLRIPERKEGIREEIEGCGKRVIFNYLGLRSCGFEFDYTTRAWWGVRARLEDGSIFWTSTESGRRDFQLNVEYSTNIPRRRPSSSGERLWRCASSPLRAAYGDLTPSDFPLAHSVRTS